MFTNGYLEPLGTPYYWRDETTGRLAVAVQIFIDDNILTSLLKDYLVYVLRAPCWRRFPDVSYEYTQHLDSLILRCEQATKAQEVEDVLEACLQIGIDPL